MRHAARHSPETRYSRCRPAAAKQRGIALILVLWLVVLISVIGSSHARNTRIETSLAFNQIGAARARALAEAGINRAIMELFVSNRSRRWPPDGSVRQVRLDNGNVNVAIRDASGLLDLNNAAPAQLQALLEAAGVEESGRQQLVDAILDWRDKDKLRRLYGAEDNDYRHAGLDWGARDAPFASIDELRYVLGMTRELFEQLAPYLTVYSARNDVNLQYAPPWLFTALTGRERQSSADLADNSTAQAGGPFHITAWASSDGGSRASIEAVLRISRTGREAYKILSWRTTARSAKPAPG